MSFRQGLELIAGAGATPYINEQTGNWEIGGVDTGVPAKQIKVSVSEYNELIKSGRFDNNKLYFLTDSTPLLFTDKQVLSSNWTKITDTRYENVISIQGVSPTDIVMVDIASSVSDDIYVEHKSLMDEAGIQRIRSTNNNVVIVASSPINTNILVDITVTKCVLGE